MTAEVSALLKQARYIFSPAAAGVGAFSEIHLLLTVSSQSTRGPMSGIHAGPACHPAHR